MALKKYRHSKFTKFRMKHILLNKEGDVKEEIFFDFVPREGIPAVYVTADKAEQEIIEGRADFGKLIFEVGGKKQKTPTILIDADEEGNKVYKKVKEKEEPLIEEVEEEDILEGKYDKRFVAEKNLNGAAKKIREAYAVDDFRLLQGKEKLKKFADANNILLPEIFEDHKTLA